MFQNSRSPNSDKEHTVLLSIVLASYECSLNLSIEDLDGVSPVSRAASTQEKANTRRSTISCAQVGAAPQLLLRKQKF